MQPMPGLFGLAQFTRETNALMRVLGVTGTSDPKPDVIPTGKIFTVRIHVCRQCGFVELVDDSDKG